MASIICLNPKAELARHAAALDLNISGAKGLQEIMKTSLGPKGTVKMLVSGAGDLKLTKDGCVLLHEMQIQHPTAAMIAKAVTAQDDITGDGTTSTVLLCGELLKQAESYISEGLHPRVITDGFEIACQKTLAFLETFKQTPPIDHHLLVEVARTSLSTKINSKLANHLSECIVDAVLAVRIDNTPPDLHMVEIQVMHHESDMDTKLIRGLVFDHGSRHPNMPKELENVFILTCNVSLEYEKTEVNSGFFYKSAAEREKLVASEREFIMKRVQKIVDLKKEVCDEATKKDGKKRGFVVINQKGIDPPSLDLLSKNGILALRRAKRRNMERLQLAVGGEAVNSVDDLTPNVLGYAGIVYEYVLGEEKYTFVENCKDPKSVTLLLKGPSKYVITQIKDAIHDGLRAVYNAIVDMAVVPGAGSFEIAAHCMLKEEMNNIKGRQRLGVQAYADALLIIPKILANNSGFDVQEAIVQLIEECVKSGGKVPVGFNINQGGAFYPTGIWDNVLVKRSSLSSSCVLASNLLQVDEVVRAGMTNLKGTG